MTNGEIQTLKILWHHNSNLWRNAVKLGLLTNGHIVQIRQFTDGGK